MAPIYAGMTKPEYSIPNGHYPARLFQIIQLGSQEFGKNTPKPWFSPQILLGFELPSLTYENQNGETVSNIKSGTYFLSLNPSKNGTVGLREIIDGMHGSAEYTEEELEKFDISSFLGKECAIILDGVESKGQVYQNIVGVEPLDFKKALLDFPVYRKPIMVSTEDFANIDAFYLPNWIVEKIQQSKEYRELFEEKEPETQQAPAPLTKEDVPFGNNHFAGAISPAAKPAEEEMPDDFLL